MLKLFKRSTKCTGSAQMCETGTDTTNTLAICLAVIIPVVVVIVVVSYFIFKAYRRNKKEAMEDNDPDFNVDNIMLPEYNHNTSVDPNMMMQQQQPYQNNNPGNIYSYNNTTSGFESTDSFGNPFSEKNTVTAPSQVRLNPAMNYKMTTSANAITLPFGSSKEDLDQYTRNLGLDFHEFNYPIKKMNSPVNNNYSRNNSRDNSRHTSFSENSRPLTGYEVSTNSSPLKNRVITNSNSLNSNINKDIKVESVVNDNDDANTLDVQTIKSANVPFRNEKDEPLEDYENPFTDNNKPRDVLKSQDSSPSVTSPVSSPLTNDSNRPQISSSHTTIANEINDVVESKQTPSNSNSVANSAVASAATSPIKNASPVKNVSPVKSIRQQQPVNSEDVPDFKKLAEKDTPLSTEEEEQLNRMKSVYQVYFSRDGSIKRKDDNTVVDPETLPPLPNMQIPTEDGADSQQNAAPSTNINVLSIPQDNEENEDFRASVSSSVYLPVNGDVNYSNTDAGQFAHQKFGQMIQKGAMDPNQQQQYQNYTQNYQQYPQQYQNYPQQGYPQGYQQGYPQQGYPQQGNPQNQQQYQQYYNQYPQGYQQYPNQQYGYAANQRNQQYANVPRALPKLEELPLPHQLNKRTSTLESFTTFSAQSHKNPVTNPGIQIDQTFDPIHHVDWKDKSEATPSPSQIRNSIVMFNPVGLTDNTKTFVSKGTAKERVREMQKQQQQQQQQYMNDGYSIPASPSVNGPLYGFYDNVMERPHGAENLIPRSGSQADLRKQMDNANV